MALSGLGKSANSFSKLGGAGGAGGVRHATGYSVPAGTYAVVVGTGGAGQTSAGAQGADGVNSSFAHGPINATGGGGGGAGGATTIVNAPTTSVDQSSSMTNTAVSLSHPSRTLAAVNAAA